MPYRYNNRENEDIILTIMEGAKHRWCLFVLLAELFTNASTVRNQAIQSEFIDRNGRSTTTREDGASAARHAEINLPQEDFADYQNSQTYVRERQKYERRRPWAG
jgi:hypothetical protein